MNPYPVPTSLRDFRQHLTKNIRLDSPNSTSEPVRITDVDLVYCRFFPQLLDAVVTGIENRVQSGAHPGDIAVLSPFVSDSLRFSLQTRLEKKGIKMTTHRPGRELRNEPAVRCLFTLAKLAYPQWKLKVTPLEFRAALMTAIDGMDLIRADLLAGTMLSRKPDGDPLNPFSTVETGYGGTHNISVGRKI